MTTVRELHEQAMQQAELALMARHRGDVPGAIALANQACQLEEQAAALVPLEKTSEPTRSILYRSAASLAYQAKDYAKARRLIGQGLAGYPPPQIEQEFWDLSEDIRMTTADTLPCPDRLCLRWTADRVRWVHAGRIVRAVRRDPSGQMVIELWRAGLPGVAYMGQSVWQDADGRTWRVARTDVAGNVLALWMEAST